MGRGCLHHGRNCGPKTSCFPSHLRAGKTFRDPPPPPPPPLPPLKGWQLCVPFPSARPKRLAPLFVGVTNYGEEGGGGGLQNSRGGGKSSFTPIEKRGVGKTLAMLNWGRGRAGGIKRFNTGARSLSHAVCNLFHFVVPPRST